VWRVKAISNNIIYLRLSVPLSGNGDTLNLQLVSLPLGFSSI
jgi:hypothetical protein